VSDDTVLSVRNLRTTFHTDQEVVRAVDGASFDVPGRRTLGIVGESGSGKSVTARSILGLIEEPGRVHPDSEIRYHNPAFVQRVAREYPNRVRRAGPDETGTGEPSSEGAEGNGKQFVTVERGTGEGSSLEVEAGSVDLVAAPADVVRSVRGSEIAMVFQDALSSLNPVYTVGNQISELLETHRGLEGTAATETAADLLGSVGIPDPKRRLKEYPHQFSGGMQQRAVIALALACDPSVLLCDEPTTALDVTIQAQVLELLERLQSERDLSIVFITHDMGVIARVADTVAVMYAGEIVERASVDRLFGAPKHPYTRGLLRSIPGLTGDVDRLPTIDGSVPTPNEPATYCRYAPRCPEAFAECHEVHPESVPAREADERAGAGGGDGTDHTAACLLYPESASLDGRVEMHRALGRPDRSDTGDDDGHDGPAESREGSS